MDLVSFLTILSRKCSSVVYSQDCWMQADMRRFDPSSCSSNDLIEQPFALHAVNSCFYI
jgi:hypothetical protein